jgi:energy-coupling factor transport system permease protein
VFCITTCSLVYQNLWVQAILLLISLSLLLSKRLSIQNRQKLYRNLSHLIWVIISIFIIQLLFVQTGEEIIHKRAFRITWDGVSTALLVSNRLIILALLAAWLLGMSIKDYLDAFALIRIPETIAVMTALTIRFVPLLAGELLEGRRKLVMRGIDLSGLGLKRRMKLYINLVMPVLGKTMQDVKFQAIALDLRGFRNGRRHSRFNQRKLTWVDCLVLIGAVGLSVLPAVV